ncbi:MAG: hypothetical protein HAW62_06055 [Endozoicomonadaceae bacterium]|nr:hypothetical protein [Endozoicomonadaceae bacterium]
MAPGPVFTTWLSLTGTSIFNGINNPPRQIDFKSNLLDIANLLQPAGLPLIIVYDEVGMNPGEKDILISDFQHDNILIINTQDLHFFKLWDFFKKNIPRDVNPLRLMLDNLRINIIQNKKEFIEQAIKIADSKNKLSISSYLKKTEKGSLIYTDTDNIFFRSPLYQIAPDTLVQSVTLMPDVFSINLQQCERTHHISKILDINMLDLLENEGSVLSVPVEVKKTKIELKRQCYNISHALQSNVLAMNMVGSNDNFNFSFNLLHFEFGYIRADQRSIINMAELIEISEGRGQNPTMVKLAAIHQYAWLHIGRTISWRKNPEVPHSSE